MIIVKAIYKQVNSGSRALSILPKVPEHIHDRTEDQSQICVTAHMTPCHTMLG